MVAKNTDVSEWQDEKLQSAGRKRSNVGAKKKRLGAGIGGEEARITSK